MHTRSHAAVRPSATEVLTVASVPSSHVYVRHLSSQTGPPVVRLPDPHPDHHGRSAEQRSGHSPSPSQPGRGARAVASASSTSGTAARTPTSRGSSSGPAQSSVGPATPGPTTSTTRPSRPRCVTWTPSCATAGSSPTAGGPGRCGGGWMSSSGQDSSDAATAVGSVRSRTVRLSERWAATRAQPHRPPAPVRRSHGAPGSGCRAAPHPAPGATPAPHGRGPGARRRR